MADLGASSIPPSLIFNDDTSTGLNDAAIPRSCAVGQPNAPRIAACILEPDATQGRADTIDGNPILRLLIDAGWCVDIVVADNDSQSTLQTLGALQPDAVLLDGRTSHELATTDVASMCRAIKETEGSQNASLLVLMSEADEELALNCVRNGADNFFCEPLSQSFIRARLDALFRARKNSTLLDTTDRIVLSLMCAVEAKDFRQRRHAERVAGYANQVADTLGLNALDRRTLYYGALLHDVGNIGIADSILLKPSGLSDWEFDEVRLHPIIGEQICRPLLSLAPILPLIRSHHEKLDGSGYPDGLKGDELPFLVKVLSIIDVYDTLRSDRVYRGAFGHDDALDILRQEVTRGWWDSEVVELLDTLTAPEKDFPLV